MADRLLTASKSITEHLTGVVYFAHHLEPDPAHVGMVKIGYTMNLRQRMRKLRCIPLVVVMGGPDLERFLHGLFADQREEGEWFAWAGDLARFLEYVHDHKVGEQVPWLD